MKTLKNNQANANDHKTHVLEEEFVDYESFMTWKKSYSGDTFFQWIKDKYDDFELESIQKDKHIFFFKNESTFAFRIDTEMIDLHPNLLWNYWKDTLKENGYILKNTEHLQIDKLNTLRYYLKPSSNFKIKNEQLFGNITLEIIKNEALTKYIMLKCNWHAGFKLKKPFSNALLIELFTH